MTTEPKPEHLEAVILAHRERQAQQVDRLIAIADQIDRHLRHLTHAIHGIDQSLLTAVQHRFDRRFP